MAEYHKIAGRNRVREARASLKASLRTMHDEGYLDDLDLAAAEKDVDDLDAATLMMTVNAFKPDAF